MPAERAVVDPPARPVLEVQNLDVGYPGRRVLSDVQWSVRPGEYWFLLGPNGSGKTTLLRAVLGLVRPLAGAIERDPANASLEHTGFVPQHSRINPTLPTTVREFVALGAVGIARAARQEDSLAWALARVGLSDHAGRDLRELSGGQRQRALVARALVRRPRLLVLDEPTEGLDAASEEAFLATTRDLHRDERLTVLFVTHKLRIAARYATHVALFATGRVRSGTRDAVLVPADLEAAFGVPLDRHGELPAVIEAFAASWPLFATSYLAGFAIAFVLALIGVWVVARDQIFLGVAVAQASTLGVAAALWIGALGASAGLDAFRGDAVASGLAVLTAVATSLFTVLRRGDRETAEAVTGWVFLVAASLPTLLLARDPHGLEEVHQLLFSTLLGATRADLWLFGALAIATALLVARHHEPLRLLAIDPEIADAVGLASRVWLTALAIWLGVAVGLSIRVSGTLYTFGCLVLPSLVAKHLVREVRALIWLAPAIAVAAAAVGFVFANYWDTPPAHMTVALLCGALGAVWLREMGSVRFFSRSSRAP